MIALLLLAALAQRPFAEERSLLDRRLETLRRLLPDGPTAAADVAALREMGAAAALQGFDAVARPPEGGDALGFVVVDVAAAGRFADLDRFFRQIALQPRPIDVASLSLHAAPDDLVRVGATVRFPFRQPRAPLPPPPLGVRAPSGAPRPQADAFLRDQSLALAKSESLAALRRARRNPRLFLAELAAIARDRPVVFSEATLADEFVVRGLTLGEAASRDLEARFERGFFRMSEFLMARLGACRRFEAKGRSPVAGPEAELPLPAEDPFRQEAAPCRVDRDDGRGPAIQAGDARRGATGLTVRLRDADLADLFFVLHEVTGRGFVVDGDVAGRVQVELTGLALDDVLQALRKSGLHLSEFGSLLRVAARPGDGRGDASGTAAEAGDGEPRRVAFGLKREGVREILAVMAEIEPSLAALGPQGFLGRASLWLSDAPLADVRGALLSAAGLLERVEEGRRVLRRPASSEDPVFPVAASAPDRRLSLRPSEVALADFELAGIAADRSGAGVPVAFGYGPTGRLHAYRAGDRLADAVVRSVSAGELELETDEGTLRLALPALGR